MMLLAMNAAARAPSIDEVQETYRRVEVARAAVVSVARDLLAAYQSTPAQVEAAMLELGALVRAEELARAEFAETMERSR
jgi:hypothetical protein